MSPRRCMYSSVPRSGNWWNDTSYDGMLVTQQVHNHDKLIYAYAVRLRLNNRPTHEIWIVMVANSVLCSCAGLAAVAVCPLFLREVHSCSCICRSGTMYSFVIMWRVGASAEQMLPLTTCLCSGDLACNTPWGAMLFIWHYGKPYNP